MGSDRYLEAQAAMPALVSQLTAELATAKQRIVELERELRKAELGYINDSRFVG